MFYSNGARVGVVHGFEFGIRVHLAATLLESTLGLDFVLDSGSL
jgi:hypothetical protein